MDRLADAIASQTAAILAAVSSAASSAASPSTVTLDATAVAALTTRQRPTDINGQRVRPADFDRNAPVPADDTYSLPADPKNSVDHGMIAKNENHLIQWVATNRIDPRFGSRQFFDDRIRNHVNSPFKLAVFDHPSYEDYARGTSIFYDAMRVWHARLAPGGSLHHLVDDASPRTIWNLHMKKLQHVKDEAYTDPTHGFTAFMNNARKMLDTGGDLHAPPDSLRELKAKINAWNAQTKELKTRPIMPEFQDWGVKMRFASKNSAGVIERNADGSIKNEYGGYEQVNYLYDRNLVLSRSEFRSLALVLGDAYHTYCKKGEQAITGRIDDLLCADAQLHLSRTHPPNYLYEIRQAYYDAYPESQRDLVMRIRAATQHFKYDRSLVKLSMYINQWQVAQAALVRYGEVGDHIDDKHILETVLTTLYNAFMTLPPEQQDGLNLEYKELANSYSQQHVLESSHKHKHVFATLSALKTEVMRIEDLHQHAARTTEVPDYLLVPTPKEPTPVPARSRLYHADSATHALSGDETSLVLSDRLMHLEAASHDPGNVSLLHAKPEVQMALVSGRLSGSPMAQYVQRNAPRDLRLAESRARASADARRSSHTPGGYHGSPPHLGGRHPHSNRGGDDEASRATRNARALSRLHNSRSRSLPPTRSGPKSPLRSSWQPQAPPGRAIGRPKDDRARNTERRPGPPSASGGRDREYIPKKAYFALKRVLDLHQKTQNAPATAQNNLKEAAETCGEALKTLDDFGAFVTDDMPDARAYDDQRTFDDYDDDDGHDQPDVLTLDDVVRQERIPAHEHEQFTALYEQLSAIDRDLTPSELYSFALNGMRQLEHAVSAPRSLEANDIGHDHGQYMFGPSYNGDDAADGKKKKRPLVASESGMGPEFSSDPAGDGPVGITTPTAHKMHDDHDRHRAEATVEAPLGILYGDLTQVQGNRMQPLTECDDHPVDANYVPQKSPAQSATLSIQGKLRPTTMTRARNCDVDGHDDYLKLAQAEKVDSPSPVTAVLRQLTPSELGSELGSFDEFTLATLKGHDYVNALRATAERRVLSPEPDSFHHELYDSGATNCFRHKPVNAIPGSHRPLRVPRKVSAADEGITAVSTYFEIVNMLSEDGAYLVPPVFSHSECFAIGAGWGEQESKE